MYIPTRVNGIKTISESLYISRQFCPPKLFIRPPTPPLGAFGLVLFFCFNSVFIFLKQCFTK